MSDKFGIIRDENGSIRVEFFTAGGVLTARVVFDQQAADEFAAALVDVVHPPRTIFAQ